MRLTLGLALTIAAENSREFQDRKERVYRVALALTGVRYDFESRFFGLAAAEIESTGVTGDDVQNFRQSSSFGFTRMLKRGGLFVLEIGNNLLRVISDPHERSLDTFYNLTIDLPLLRGAGVAVASENLIQAERDALYEIRDFEQFKKDFVFDLVSEYYRILQSLDVVKNERQNAANLTATRERNEWLGRAGRISEIQVDQARQDELSARNRVIVAEVRFESQVDQFLESIGLPPDLPVEIPPEELRVFGEEPEKVDLPEERALTVAFAHRLDFANVEARVADAARKVVVAENALQAGLDLVAQASGQSEDREPVRYKFKEGTYSAGLDLDLPFDRLDERNEYRRSLLDLEVARREAAAGEDTIKIDVRRDLRDLREAREAYDIQRVAVATAERRVESARLFLDAGRAETRDLLEAQDDLVSAQNQLIAARIDYELARLGLFRDLGVLVVSPEGLHYEATDELLAES
jgi:outer membrane protein TolC